VTYNAIRFTRAGDQPKCFPPFESIECRTITTLHVLSIAIIWKRPTLSP
jgi:hypothetical protein